MAQKRMIDKKISVSEQIANLKRDGQLIYSWAIPHSDDVGLLPISHRSLKAMIIPLIDMPLEEFDSHINNILCQGLWRVFEWEGERFYQIINFTKYQVLKKDRQPQTLLKITYEKSPKKSWEILEKILGFKLEDTDFQMESSWNPDGIQLASEVKRREVKRSKEKRKEVFVEKILDTTETETDTDTKKNETTDPPKGGVEKSSIFLQENKIKKIDVKKCQKKIDPRLEESIRFLKEIVQGPLNGSALENRQYCYLLLKKMEEEYPNENSVDLIKFLVLKGIEKDPYLGKTMGGFKTIYYNTGRIIQAIKLADIITQRNKKGGCANLDDFLKNNPKT